MAEYIERDKLPVKQISIGGPMMPRFISVVYADDIAAAPAADVVEVVRCKECRFYETNVEYYGGGTKDVCRLLKRQMQEDDFCSYGERKDT